MPLLYYVQNSVVTISILAIILYYALGQGGRRQAQDSLFVALLFCSLYIIVFEFAIDLLTGRSFTGSRILLTISSFGLYMGNPILAGLYLLYLDQLRRRWIRIPLGIGLLASIPFLISLALCSASLFNGIIFFIDNENLYQRGPLFFLITLVSYGGMVAGLAYLLCFRSSFRQRDFSLFLLFPLPILLGSLLQIRFYGIEVAGVSMVITLLVVYLQIQNTQANKDYLTHLYNRSISEQYLNHLITHQKPNKPIGCMMLDINNFKSVNDLYGHDFGDKALRTVSRLLLDSFGSSWFIGRHGGDEFILMKEGVRLQDLEKGLAHFNEQLRLFNAKKILPFSLSLSAGVSLYEIDDALDTNAFIKALYNLMYEAKRAYHLQEKLKISPDW